IKTIALGLTHTKPVPRPIQRLGVDRVHHHTVIQKKIHYSPLRLLDGCPKLSASAAPLIEPAPELRQPFGGLLDLELFYFLAAFISRIQLMAFVGPIHSQIVSLQSLFLLWLCFMANSTTDERKFALSVLYGTTFYRTLIRSFAGRDSLSLLLCRADWGVWVLLPASRGVGIALRHRSMDAVQQSLYGC